MAHTNVPGSKHRKRYEDIEEILDHGIDVWTTVNIQHLESLNDLVFELTGVKVRETFPDYVLERAERYRLIDISPEALIERLKAGKVYPPGKIETALTNFFQKSNLAALRELSLREVADEVEETIEAEEDAGAASRRGSWSACGRRPTPSASSAGAGGCPRRFNAPLSVVYLEKGDGGAELGRPAARKRRKASRHWRS